MKKDKIIEILNDLGIKFKESGQNNKYISITCPFAEMSKLHKHETDRTGSGYVSVSDDKTSYFGCFTCENNASMYKSIEKLHAFYKADKYLKALNKVRQYENKFTPYFQDDLQEIESFLKKARTRLLQSTHPMVNLPSVMYDTDSINNYDYDDNKILLGYFISRGYSAKEAETIINNFKIMIDKKGKRGIFIVRDFLNHIVGTLEIILSGSDNAPKYIAHFPSGNYLLNEDIFFNRTFKSINLIVAEGLLDITRLSLKKNSSNVVALQGKIKTNQMNKILYFSKNVYFFTDMDPVGRDNVKKLGEYYEKNKSLFGYVKILVFNDFKENDDPDNYFKNNNINKYDFKNSFIYWKTFVDGKDVVQK